MFDLCQKLAARLILFGFFWLERGGSADLQVSQLVSFIGSGFGSLSVLVSNSAIQFSQFTCLAGWWYGW